MQRVIGIGGVFFKSRNPADVIAWYEKHLGMKPAWEGGVVFEWKQADRPDLPGQTAWSPFAADTDYYETNPTRPVTNPFPYLVRDFIAGVHGCGARPELGRRRGVVHGAVRGGGLAIGRRGIWIYRRRLRGCRRQFLFLRSRQRNGHPADRRGRQGDDVRGKYAEVQRGEIRSGRAPLCLHARTEKAGGGLGSTLGKSKRAGRGRPASRPGRVAQGPCLF